jgi:hypothetical protein
MVEISLDKELGKKIFEWCVLYFNLRHCPEFVWGLNYVERQKCVRMSGGRTRIINGPSGLKVLDLPPKLPDSL